ncbi:MAG: C40 family peptidase [Muribaculaceae bacterium]|nr:C40 family peptidase [Muribaculaceae bacterium]
MKHTIYAILPAIAAALLPLSSAAQSSIKALERASAIVEEVKAAHAPDKRQTVYEIKAYNDPDGGITVGGKTSSAEARGALVAQMNASGHDWTDRIVLLPDTLWAQPHISVACLRTGPAHAAEMASQAIMGMPLRVLEKEGGWYRVQTPDGYIAWVTDSSVEPKTAAEMKAWRSARRYIVTAPYQTRAYTTAQASGLRDVVSDLVNGNIVEAVEAPGAVENGRVLVQLPDGRRGFAPIADLTPIEVWADQNFDPEKILDIAYSMEGTPYLWGGTSVKSLDCSGLAKVSYLSNGIILMRDASQQALTGTRIEAKDWRDCRAGDLLFFGNAKTGKITHVAIYDHDGKYVHSSGRVKRNSVDPDDPSYLTTPFLHAVRIAGNEETPGITRARNHPWYFNL